MRGARPGRGLRGGDRSGTQLGRGAASRTGGGGEAAGAERAGPDVTVRGPSPGPGERRSRRDWGRGAEPGLGREEGPGWGLDPTAKRWPGRLRAGMLARAWWWGPRPGVRGVGGVVSALGEPAAGARDRGPGLGALAWDEATGARHPPPPPLFLPAPPHLGSCASRGFAPSSPWLLGTRDLLVPAAS